MATFHVHRPSNRSEHRRLWYVEPTKMLSRANECKDTLPHGALVSCISVVDCSGPSQLVYSLDTVALDVQAYQLHDDESGRTRGRIPSLGEAAEDDESRTRIITLPNVLLKDDWDSYETSQTSLLLANAFQTDL